MDTPAFLKIEWFFGALMVALVGILVVRLFQVKRKPRPLLPGEKLVLELEGGSGRKAFVGVPPETPIRWAQVIQVSDTSVSTDGSENIELARVKAFYVTYPSGTLLDHVGDDLLQIPSDVRGLIPCSSPEADELGAVDLARGKRYLRITYGPSPSHCENRNYYATTLTNISRERVRVLKFGGYVKAGKKWRLSTVTGAHYSACEFREWYGMKSDWIDPSASVTDFQNYGGRCSLWAYYCVTHSGEEFVAGEARN